MWQWVFAAAFLHLATAFGGSELEWTCRGQASAVWSEASSSCLVPFTQNLSWADAMYFCGRFKPAASFGRLVHIQSAEILRFVESYLPTSPFWLGMRSTLKGSPEFLAHWRWMEDLFSPAKELPWHPGTAANIVIGRQQQCLRHEPGSWIETGCDNTLPFVCEYLPEPAHYCAMQNDSVWNPSSASCLVWYKPHLPWTEAMQFCSKTLVDLRKAPVGLEGRLAHLDTPATLAFLRGRLPRQYLWIGLKTQRRRSKDLAADWRWMKDPLTPVQQPIIDLRNEIRVDLNQEWADCMNILDDRLNDYFCHEALPFLCEFSLPERNREGQPEAPSQEVIKESNNLHRDIAEAINSVNEGLKPAYVPAPEPEPAFIPTPRPETAAPTLQPSTVSHRQFAPRNISGVPILRLPALEFETNGLVRRDPTEERRSETLPAPHLPPASTTHLPQVQVHQQIPVGHSGEVEVRAETTASPPPIETTAFVPWAAPRTTTFDPRPAHERLESYCISHEHGVWSAELQSCFLWFHRARSWDDAMDHCAAEAPRDFSVGRLAHIRDDETVELIRGHVRTKHRLFWLAAKRVEPELAEPMGSWRWMDNRVDYLKDQRVYDPREMGVRLGLRYPESDCLVWRGSSWAATPCHFYVSFLCEYLPYGPF